MDVIQKQKYEPREILSSVHGRVKGDALLKNFGFCKTSNGTIPTLLLVDVVLPVDGKWIKIDHVWVRVSNKVLEECFDLSVYSRIAFTVIITKYYEYKNASGKEKFGIRKIQDIAILNKNNGISFTDHLKRAEVGTLAPHFSNVLVNF